MRIDCVVRRLGISVGDIPSRYTSDVVLNQQARVAHGGGMADSLPVGPVAGSPWRYRTHELMADP
jgi:hypothetical protein